MADPEHTFSCEILTPRGPVCSVDAASMTLPASDGQFGVLPGRAPLAALIGSGMLVIEKPDEQRLEFYVQGGFASMADDVATVLAEQCTPLPELDPEAIWQELQDARKIPAHTDEEFEARDRLIDAARDKFRIAQSYRKRFMPEQPEGEEHPDRTSDADWD